ncbi:hypothetical protein ACFQZ4_50810 [Catellatospora coxensis]|uniref:Uncharacterized protein n=1 Tax=Catellatospora coxensis TaxID=310354 RepID=A0A8J3KL99_9ACTN|nr:hypothetical protein [Catellatospora coxensis]GIG05052.1 hypothetical protein Cco03nite_17520 [Catellatospora coxensis]
MSYVALLHAASEIGWPVLQSRSAAALTDADLRRELANAHTLHELVSKRGMPRDREMLRLRLAELDAEYLHRFPAAGLSWPWPCDN